MTGRIIFNVAVPPNKLSKIIVMIPNTSTGKTITQQQQRSIIMSFYITVSSTAQTNWLTIQSVVVQHALIRDLSRICILRISSDIGSHICSGNPNIEYVQYNDRDICPLSGAHLPPFLYSAKVAIAFNSTSGPQFVPTDFSMVTPQVRQPYFRCHKVLQLTSTLNQHIECWTKRSPFGSYHLQMPFP